MFYLDLDPQKRMHIQNIAPNPKNLSSQAFSFK